MQQLPRKMTSCHTVLLVHASRAGRLIGVCRSLNAQQCPQMIWPRWLMPSARSDSLWRVRRVAGRIL